MKYMADNKIGFQHVLLNYYLYKMTLVSQYMYTYVYIYICTYIHVS